MGANVITRPSQKTANCIEFLKGVGPQKAQLLSKELGIRTFGDLLQFFPFRYIDRTVINKIADITAETQYVQFRGVISNPSLAGRKYQKRLTARLTDQSGSLELVWFKGANWILKYLHSGTEYVVFGKPTLYRGRFNMAHPEMELATEFSASGGLQPVYSSTEKLKTKGLDSKGLAKLTRTVLQMMSEDDIPENLPTATISKHHVMPRFNAYQQIHFPDDEPIMNQARNRLIFEELFYIQLKLLLRRTHRLESSNGFVFKELDKYFNPFFKNVLEFELTAAQKRVLKDIRRDVLSGKPMNRLLQGDVGSGKTIVALMAVLMALDNGYQVCVMTPTEILAQQHYKTFDGLLSKLKITVGLLTGSIKVKPRKDILNALRVGELKVLIGTHAVIEDAVDFEKLGLVVIDEQHRFGVAQRARLSNKNQEAPHVLVMTATPIPRTLAMTLYGDLDVSVIDELPPGRKPIITVHRTDSSRLRVFGFMKEEIAKGRQVYVVYPLIEESETMDYKDLMDGWESITREFRLPEYKVGIMHGRMTAENKEYEMQRFIKGDTDIMVATSVIEVGVDVPNVSLMVIESAERFGLSQLHQLRGRVGRGAEQSYCILITEEDLNYSGKTRIKTMVASNDGFHLAEVDLKLRGPGEMEGTQQSGMLELKVADLTKDQEVLIDARKEASEILAEDPDLNSSANKVTKAYLDRRGKGTDWGSVA